MFKKLLLPLILLFSVLLFSPSSTNFFSSDDWFHLRISQIENLKEFTNFFSFTPTSQSAAFYRPLPTQVFFFTFYQLFSLNPLPYHFFVLIIFIANLLLIYSLAKNILKSNNQALLTTFIYAISVTNFTRLYFLSAFQEILMAFFFLLSLLFYLKQSRAKKQKFLLFSLACFILSLLSKETAVVLPLVLVLLNYSQNKANLKKILPFFIILLPYLYLRLFIFQSPLGDSYLWSFSPLKAANTLFWYTLWSIGAPETLVDYVTSNLVILPRFFTDFKLWAYVILTLLSTASIILLIIFLKKAKKLAKKLIFPLGLYLISLLPVLFLPWHKFTLELTLPMIGIGLLLAQLISKRQKLSLLFLFLFIALNLSMNYFTYSRHYSVNRTKLAKKVFQFFQTNYPQYPQNSYFEFINDTGNYGKEWGSSKQIAHAVSKSDLFKVFYQDKNIQVYYQDFPGSRPQNKQKIAISTRQFFQVK